MSVGGKRAAEPVEESLCRRQHMAGRPGCALGRLSAAQRLHDANLIGRTERESQVERLLAVDEESHMATHALLLVDHPEADAGVLTVQIDQEFA